MTENKIPECFACHEVFDTYKELALHVVANQNTHRKSLKWAAKVLTDVQRLNAKQDKPQGRIALTEEEKEAKKDCQRQISGELSFTRVVCPSCLQVRSERIEIEHLENPTSWRWKGKIAIECDNCGQDSRKPAFRYLT